ncbi:hypothetical protein AG1IA_09069 [Rhizoctonia solani AG-1 IA]|uniref:Uncharacterized protein n=1 Tax=Thanatephorus cucumeris (strain AG1-IA) TaxID=983506 RepID=L8WFF3_THACA|nr:hypothetical protein AG1IA_09069 [Rhizoctonia solani AG-1 IA]
MTLSRFRRLLWSTSARDTCSFFYGNSPPAINRSPAFTRCDRLGELIYEAPSTKGNFAADSRSTGPIPKSTHA